MHSPLLKEKQLEDMFLLDAANEGEGMKLKGSACCNHSGTQEHGEWRRECVVGGECWGGGGGGGAGAT